MPSSDDIPTSATRRSSPLAPLHANDVPHAPRPNSCSHHASAKQRGHGRTRSFLTGLLKPSTSTKRSSLPPPPTASPRPSQTHGPTADAGLRAPAARRKRISAPADFKGKESVSAPRLLPAPFSPNMGSPPRSVSRSSSYLDTKPLPLDGDQKTRLSSWEWGGDGAERGSLQAGSAKQANDKGKSKANDDVDSGDDYGAAAQRARQGWAHTSTVDDLEHLRASSSMPDGISRLSIASDTPSTIAFPGPSFVAPHSVDPHMSHPSPATGQRNLSPIPETETVDGDRGPRIPFVSPPVCPNRTGATAVSSRPILHINPGLPPSRKPSNMSMSVYSRQSIVEQEHDDTEPEMQLRSHFSPDTPPPCSLEGLAIRSASPALSPATPAPPLPLLEHAVVQPLPKPSTPAQFALATKPSFSGFRWASSSSIETVTSVAGERTPPSLFDEPYLPAPSSVLTAATSTFEAAAPSPAASDDGGEKGVYVHERGMWREDWRWTMLRRSMLVVDRELAPEVTLEVALAQAGLKAALEHAAAMAAEEQAAAFVLHNPPPAILEWQLPEDATEAATANDRPVSPVREAGDATAVAPRAIPPVLHADVTPLLPAAVAPLVSDTSLPAVPAAASSVLPAGVAPVVPAAVEPVVPPSSSSPALAAPAMPAPTVAASAAFTNSAAASPSAPAPAVPVHVSLPAPVLLPLSALPQHLREKALPPIPDNASTFTVDRSSEPEEVRIEVYCQRELVRRTKDRYERYVLERTMLYGEDADDLQLGGVV
ncbi:hypothetical protein JCM3770_001733 [Rhodotorula araucariae]